MVSFVSKNKCSMKGIIDFEIARKRNKKEFYIPVFYSSPSRILASGDAVFNTDYLGSAEEAKNNTIKYLKENNVSATSEKIGGELKYHLLLMIFL